MLARCLSASILGVDGALVTVEVDVAFGLPGLTIVGLAGSAVLESRERVRSAIRNAGFELPARRMTVNLAPADLKKEGTAHDLAIAIGILVASDQLTLRRPDMQANGHAPDEPQPDCGWETLAQGQARLRQERAGNDGAGRAGGLFSRSNQWPPSGSSSTTSIGVPASAASISKSCRAASPPSFVTTRR